MFPACSGTPRIIITSTQHEDSGQSPYTQRTQYQRNDLFEALFEENVWTHLQTIILKISDCLEVPSELIKMGSKIPNFEIDFTQMGYHESIHLPKTLECLFPYLTSITFPPNDTDVVDSEQDMVLCLPVLQEIHNLPFHVMEGSFLPNLRLLTTQKGCQDVELKTCSNLNHLSIPWPWEDRKCQEYPEPPPLPPDCQLQTLGARLDHLPELIRAWPIPCWKGITHLILYVTWNREARKFRGGNYDGGAIYDNSPPGSDDLGVLGHFPHLEKVSFKDINYGRAAILEPPTLPILGIKILDMESRELYFQLAHHFPNSEKFLDGKFIINDFSPLLAPPEPVVRPRHERVPRRRRRCCTYPREYEDFRNGKYDRKYQEAKENYKAKMPQYDFEHSGMPLKFQGRGWI